MPLIIRVWGENGESAGSRTSKWKVTFICRASEKRRGGDGFHGGCLELDNRHSPYQIGEGVRYIGDNRLELRSLYSSYARVNDIGSVDFFIQSHQIRTKPSRQISNNYSV